MINHHILQTKSEHKLYSSKSIGIATCIGGPLVAGFLIGHNYKSINKPKEAQYSNIIGVIVTFLLFFALWQVPDNIIDTIPNALIPIIHTAIILGIVKYTQGDLLDQYKKDKLPFYSSWRAAGYGVLSLAILLACLFGFAYYGTDSKAYDTYLIEMEQFSQNEDVSLLFYDHIESNSVFELITEINNVTIPKWQENIEIIKKTNEIPNLPRELKERNNLLLKYCNLRIESFDYTKKRMVENTDIYSKEIEKTNTKIDLLLDALNSM